MMGVQDREGLVSLASTAVSFVGRQSELRILGDRLAAAELGHPQVVYVEGEAGGGKSTLLSEFLGSLSDAVVLQVGGDEAETLLSYGIIDQLQPGTLTSRGRTRWPSEPGCWTCSTGGKPTVRSSCSPSTICSGRPAVIACGAVRLAAAAGGQGAGGRVDAGRRAGRSRLGAVRER
jgi:hypothetical protein